MSGKSGGINKSKSLARQAVAARTSSPWHAVAIRPKGQCCEAVQAHRCARYLSGEAPRLPLPECTAAHTCTCVYKHHADRRSQPRRQEETGGLRRAGKIEQERRETRDRRKSD